jgi:hypothetical protein
MHSSLSVTFAALALAGLALPASAKVIPITTRYTHSGFQAACEGAGGQHIGGRHPICSTSKGDIVCKTNSDNRNSCVFVPNQAAALNGPDEFQSLEQVLRERPELGRVGNMPPAFELAPAN